MTTPTEPPSGAATPTTSSRLFRRSALERISSPEQIDMLMRVITPKAWLALVAIVGVLLCCLGWGWYGSLPTKVFGRCILLNPTGLADVTSGSVGRITDFLVKVGDPVTKGTVIARVAQPDLADRIEKAQARVSEIEAQAKVVREFASRSGTLSEQTVTQQQQVLERQFAAARERAALAAERARLATERAAIQEELRAQGLVTNQAVLSVRQEQAVARQEEVAAQLEAEHQKNQIKQLSLSRLERSKQVGGEVANIEAQLNEARRQVDSLRESMHDAEIITSPFSGRLTQIKAGNGSMVSQGVPVATVELNDHAAAPVEAVVYVPVSEGRKVRLAMEAHVMPSTVKREEHGFLRARVNTVSDYPATPQSMMMLLQNESLVRDLAGNTPPTELRLVLKSAPTVSGYEWSTASGPPQRLASGTMCNAEIIIQRQRPLSLVIPVLKSVAGMQ